VEFHLHLDHGHRRRGAPLVKGSSTSRRFIAARKQEAMIASLFKQQQRSVPLALAIALAGCQGDPELDVTLNRGDGLEKESIDVSEQQIIEGFARGRIRREHSVAAFRITRTPITVGLYQECVDAKGCRPTRAKCSNLADGAANEAMVCASAAEAQQFCEWHGGHLPTLSEWFLAARGPAVQRYSWGDETPSCSEHPLAAGSGAAAEDAAESCSDDPGKNRRVGRHSEGASTVGMEDVLISNAELLMGDADARFAPCRGAWAGCAVYGISPGSIDAVQAMGPIHETDPGMQERHLEFGGNPAFRCAFKEGK